MDLKLKGKTALITGGSQGIGLAVAEALAAEGVMLILSARHAAKLQKAKEQLQAKYGVAVHTHAADLSRADDIEKLVESALAAFDRIDILINNAGTGTDETIENSRDEDWYYYWDLHVMAAIRLSRALLPHMRMHGGGVILNNASICATQPLGHEPIYNTIKAALAMFGKCLAEEAIRYNIRVNTINPGLIRTEGWEKAGREEEARGGASVDNFLEGIARKYAPIGRFASPEELAHFFVFLCSDLASYAVGSSFYVDGGWLRTVN
jgi:NAD(P)-dependent dehydrogenase (short-subunit alcohol dehydrogenase family)